MRSVLPPAAEHIQQQCLGSRRGPSASLHHGPGAMRSILLFFAIHHQCPPTEPVVSSSQYALRRQISRLPRRMQNKPRGRITRTLFSLLYAEAPPGLGALGQLLHPLPIYWSANTVFTLLTQLSSSRTVASLVDGSGLTFQGAQYYEETNNDVFSAGPTVPISGVLAPRQHFIQG
jgi:hypothetical protein